MIDIVERLREADKNSVQRANGSRIFGEAADEIERLRDIVDVRKQQERIDEAIALLSAQKPGDAK